MLNLSFIVIFCSHVSFGVARDDRCSVVLFQEVLDDRLFRLHDLNGEHWAATVVIVGFGALRDSLACVESDRNWRWGLLPLILNVHHLNALVVSVLHRCFLRIHLKAIARDRCF